MTSLTLVRSSNVDFSVEIFNVGRLPDSGGRSTAKWKVSKKAVEEGAKGETFPHKASWFLTSRAETATKELPTLDRVHVVPRHGQLTLISRRVEHRMRPIDIDERVDLLEESRGARCDVHLG